LQDRVDIGDVATPDAKGTGRYLHVVAAALSDEAGRLLIARRPWHTHQGGKWEFPGGKVERGEAPLDALARELDEELGVRPLACEPLITVLHDYPDKRVRLEVWRIRGFEGSASGLEGQEVRWVAQSELDAFEFPGANLPVITALNLPDRYLITPDPGPDTAAFLRALQRAMERGVSLVQFRATNLDGDDYTDLAPQVLDICRSAGAKLMLNADPQRALALGADGVHLNGIRLRALRNRPLPRGFLVGASCHHPGELRLANSCGVDFAVLSPVKETPSHSGARHLGWRTFRDYCLRARMPVYALGGVGENDIPRARACGGQGIAAIRGLWGIDGDIRSG